jgi:signal transduction histidine kinase
VFIYALDRRVGSLIRLAGLVLVSASIFGARHHPALSGRGLVAGVFYVIAALGWLVWMFRAARGAGFTPELIVLALAGGALSGTVPSSAASVFVFAAVGAAGLRTELRMALLVAALGTLAFAITTLLYAGSALGLLAYTLGFVATALAAANSRQSVERAEQAELLLAQSQRTHEEQLRAARLAESTRIAREIHDVLAHTLAGLTIQLEATASLLEHGAGAATILPRVQRAHALAREGLSETRRAVGALRDDGGRRTDLGATLEALVQAYASETDAPAGLRVDGELGGLGAETEHAIVRTVQEALTNVRKHASGAEVSVEVAAGRDRIVVAVSNTLRGDAHGGFATSLAGAGGGFGLRGMRERAELLGGTLSAGPAGSGWRVELRVPRDASASPGTGV